MIERDYYNTGELRHETLRDGQNLKCRLWYKNGQLSYEITYYREKKHGTQKGWWKDGRIAYEAPYIQGQLHGISIGWDHNNQLCYKYHYLYGDKVSEKEYRRHELIEKLSGL